MSAFLFVDGSSSRKDDVGAWAAVAAMGEERKVLYGAVYPTTISRCELTPIIEGLRWIKIHWANNAYKFKVTLYSDSEYTVKTLCGLYPRHKNEDLWKMYDEAAKGLQLRFIWRERNSLPYMEVCDAICGSVRRTLIDALTTAIGAARNLEQCLQTEELPIEEGTSNNAETNNDIVTLS